MLKALIVDDDNNARECILKCIDWEGLGYCVVGEAYNGVEALKIATQENADVIITDIKMPLMDGTELCRKIREVMSNTSIIILSAYEDFTTARLALKYDVNDYILKPIDMNKIRHISEILVKIREEKECETYLSRILRSKSLPGDISYYLNGGETQYFMDFFQEIDKCISCDYTLMNAVCFRLITILYDFLIDIGMNVEAVKRKKDKVEDELAEMKNQREMLNYTKKIYFDILQFKHENAENYYTVLVDNIKKLVDKKYGDPMFGVSALADEMNFSTDYIGRIFKKYTDTTISNYISEIRISTALELLRDTNMPINDIALKVGYTNPNYFSKVFKLKMNVTPSSYRSMINNKD